MQVFSGRRSVLFCVPTVAVLVLLLGAGVAAGKKKAPPHPPTTLPERVSALAKQLPGVMLVDADSILNPIQKLVVDHMTEWMANRTPTDVEVRRELEGAFTLLQYPAVAHSTAFAFPWKGEMVIGAGYTLGWTDGDRQNVLAIYTSSAGRSQFVTLTNFVPRTDLHYEPLPQLAWDDLRFFVYGNRLGKSQLRLSAILYSFDGRNLKPVWETQDVYDGELEVVKDKVTIKYLKEDEYIDAVLRKRHPPRHMATYQLTPTGMQLLEDHEIPF
jgi:hypothetical protein